jgi:CTP synthase
MTSHQRVNCTTKCNLVVVRGGILSGIKKGVTASLVGVLGHGLVCPTTLKIDPYYLDVDASTMSPFEHGEMFVLDDGGENKI